MFLSRDPDQSWQKYDLIPYNESEEWSAFISYWFLRDIFRGIVFCALLHLTLLIESKSFVETLASILPFSSARYNFLSIRSMLSAQSYIITYTSFFIVLVISTVTLMSGYFKIILFKSKVKIITVETFGALAILISICIFLYFMLFLFEPSQTGRLGMGRFFFFPYFPLLVIGSVFFFSGAILRIFILLTILLMPKKGD